MSDEELWMPKWPLSADDRARWIPILRDRLSVSPYYAQQIAERGDAFLNEWIEQPWIYSYPLAKRAPPGTIIPMKAEPAGAKIYQWPIAPKKTRWQEFQEAVALYDPNQAELEFQKTMKEEYGDEEPPPSKSFIEILLQMESKEHEPKGGILMLYDRELCGFRLDALREIVDRIEQQYPNSPRIKEMRDKIQYRETHGLIDGGM